MANFSSVPKKLFFLVRVRHLDRLKRVMNPFWQVAIWVIYQLSFCGHPKNHRPGLPKVKEFKGHIFQATWLHWLKIWNSIRRTAGKISAGYGWYCPTAKRSSQVWCIESVTLLKGEHPQYSTIIQNKTRPVASPKRWINRFENEKNHCRHLRHVCRKVRPAIRPRYHRCSIESAPQDSAKGPTTWSKLRCFGI